MKKETIYLDNNATTRVDDRVISAMLPYFTQVYANAGSSHLAGLTVKEAVELAYLQVADVLDCRDTEIIITSGATESVNLAIKGLNNQNRRHIVTITTEHKAVLDTCLYMEKKGYSLTYLEVDRQGNIDIEKLKATVTEDTLMVCVMLANNETGLIHPISEISEIAHNKGALALCDATQAAGKIPVNVNSLGVDLMAFSAHKFYGPKGVGGLFVSSKIRKMLMPEILGGGQQRNLRSGTLNVPGIIGLGKACEIAMADMDEDNLRISRLRNYLEIELLNIDGSSVNGFAELRLPNTTNICFPGINSEKLILALQNISVSNGSACSAVTTEPSHVLIAMGLSNADALASIRFSLGRFTTMQEIEITVKKVTELVYKLRPPTH